MVDVAEYHSGGQFTLDPKLAIGKLCSRLLQPEDCLLYLVQSAVGSGASWAGVDVSDREVILEHDGFFPSASETAELLDWALQSGDIPRNRLGLGIAALMSAPASGLELDFPDGQSLKVQGTRGGLEISAGSSPLPFTPGASGRFRIPRRRPWWHKFWRKSLPPSVKRLRERSRFAPISLTICDQSQLEVDFGTPARANQYASWSSETISMGSEENPIFYYSDHHLIEKRVAARPGDAGWLAVPTHSHASHKFFPETLPPQPLLSRGGQREAFSYHACRAVLAWRVNRPAQVEIIQYGISLLYPAPTGVPFGLWILLADHELQTDLSCLRLAQSAALADQLEYYREDFDKLIRCFADLATGLRNDMVFRLIQRAEGG